MAFLGDTMTNLREVILLHRVHYSNTGNIGSLEKALGCLERYFFLLAFCSYVSDNIGNDFASTFSEWLTCRAGRLYPAISFFKMIYYFFYRDFPHACFSETEGCST